MKSPTIYLQQRALAEMGFYTGRLDGIDGNKTRAAYNAWLSTTTDDDGTFEDLVSTWELRYFTARELLAKGGSHSAKTPNSDPPASLWPNIREAALAADEARHRMGSGLLITSAYRSPSYNKAIGGATNSYHTRFQALDLIPLGKGTVHKLHGILKDLRREGYPGARGIGKYSSFCHTDNGPHRDF